MTSKEFCKIAGRLMRHPSVAYHEHAVRGEVERICSEHGLDFARDPFGNVLVRYQAGGKTRPLALAAHLDHPGFEIIRPISKTRWLVRFLGGVPDGYFKKGIPLRVLPGAEPARLGKRNAKKEFEIVASRPLKTRPESAVWELKDFRVRNGRIVGRACDDLIGVASILATMIELKQAQARVNVIGVISRAEEIGFRGALAVAAGRVLPKNSLVISLETSRELPGVRMGEGVILRVGDRTSIFNSDATRFLAEAAGEWKSANKTFQFQRALMSGGTCEATAYQEFGFQTAAVCVALGNYHNCGARNRIGEEYISIADALNMVELLVSAAKRMPRYPELVKKLPRRLNAMLREAQAKLKATA
jgi:putative aminopeptidase FrvX